MSHVVEARVTVASAQCEPASARTVTGSCPASASHIPRLTMPPASGDGLRSSVGDGTARRARSTASSMTSCTVIEVSTHVNPPTPSGHSRVKTVSLRPSGKVRTIPPSALVPNGIPRRRDVAVPRRIPPVRRRRRHPTTRLRRPRHPVRPRRGLGAGSAHSTVTAVGTDGCRQPPGGFVLTRGFYRSGMSRRSNGDDADQRSHSAGTCVQPLLAPPAQLVAAFELPHTIDDAHEDGRPRDDDVLIRRSHRCRFGPAPTSTRIHESTSQTWT